MAIRTWFGEDCRPRAGSVHRFYRRRFGPVGTATAPRIVVDLSAFPVTHNFPVHLVVRASWSDCNVWKKTYSRSLIGLRLLHDNDDRRHDYVVFVSRLAPHAAPARTRRRDRYSRACQAAKRG